MMELYTVRNPNYLLALYVNTALSLADKKEFILMMFIDVCN